MRILAMVMMLATFAACGETDHPSEPAGDAGVDAQPVPDAASDAGSTARCDDPDLDQPCHAGIGACQRTGTWQCDAIGHLACSAVPGSPGAESCNGLDDNCDGTVDEGFDLGAACEVGVGACLRAGRLVCDATGATRCDASPGEPSAETCNDVDDDCDGTIDNVAGLGDDCAADAPGICAHGHQVCREHAVACAPGDSAAETCDGLDDDCDGIVNNPPELGTKCDTGGLGRCAAGSQTCGLGGLLCAAVAVPTAEICNGLDDDCNGTIDDACTPAPPSARSPWNGQRTGSLWAPDRGTSSLRPRFTWLASQGASSYELQIDDSCAPNAFRTCAFSSSEIAVQLAETSYQPPQPLAVATTAPVGRRYYWRVRACGPGGCSAYTEVRYVDVGRVPGDLNGDGYPDLVVGDNHDHSNGTVYVYLSGPAGLSSTPAAALTAPAEADFYRSGAIVGDLNGDGFDDLVTSVSGFHGYEGIVYEYDGSATGVASVPTRTLASPVHTGFVFFGDTRFGAGDLDGDGLDDLVVGGFGANRAYLYLGAPAGIATTPSLTFSSPNGAASEFGFAGAGVGDLDGDGYPDLAIGAPSEPRGRGIIANAIDVPGAVFLYRGGTSVSTTPFQTIRNTVDPTRIFFTGEIHGGFDLDHDGLADVVIAPRTGLVGTPYPNAIYVYRGSPTGLVEPPAQVIRSPRSTDDSFADSLAVGDLDGDGLPDLLTGDWLAGGGGEIEQGISDLFLGRAGQFGPAQSVGNPQHQREGWFGKTVVLCDFNSDGYDDRVIAATGNDHPSSEQGVVYIYAGAPAPSPTPSLELTSPTNLANNVFGLVMSCGR